MTNFNLWNETYINRMVNYIIELEGELFVIENVPARVCVETGERFFSPPTVEKIQQTVWQQKKLRCSV